MESRRVQCPGKDFVELIRRLDPVIFESLAQRVSSFDENIETSSELERDMDEEDKVYYQMLLLYGETRIEILRTLNKHKNECERCQRDYDSFIFSQARSYLATKRRLNLMERDIRVGELAIELDKEKYLGRED